MDDDEQAPVIAMSLQESTNTTPKPPEAKQAAPPPAAKAAAATPPPEAKAKPTAPPPAAKVAAPSPTAKAPEVQSTAPPQQTSAEARQQLHVATSPNATPIRTSGSPSSTAEISASLKNSGQRRADYLAAQNTDPQPMSTRSRLRSSLSRSADPTQSINQKQWHQLTMQPRVSASQLEFPVKARLVIDELNNIVIARDEVIRLGILAVVSRQHILLFGPPGTAKSFVCAEVKRRFTPPGGEQASGGYFSVTLHQGSTLEDLIGPVDLAALEQGRFVRNLKGKLCGPSTVFAFIDEIFKAQRGLLSALLTVLNERVFYDGEQERNLPIHTVFAASNEMFTDAGQQALLDRFHFRVFVDSIHGRLVKDDDTGAPAKLNMYKSSRSINQKTINDRATLISFEDIVAVHQFVSYHDIQPLEGDWASGPSRRSVEKVYEVQTLVLALDDFVGTLAVPAEASTKVEYTKGGGLISDRRRTQLADLIVIIAASCGRTKTHPFDIIPLIYTMWKSENQFIAIKKWLLRQLRTQLRQFTSEDLGLELEILKQHLFVCDSIRAELTPPFPDGDDKPTEEEALHALVELEKEAQRVEQENKFAQRMADAKAQIRAANKEKVLREMREANQEQKEMARFEESQVKILHQAEEAALARAKAQSDLNAQREAFQAAQAAVLEEAAKGNDDAHIRRNATVQALAILDHEETEENIGKIRAAIRDGADINERSTEWYFHLNMVAHAMTQHKFAFLTELLLGKPNYDMKFGYDDVPLVFVPVEYWPNAPKRNFHSINTSFKALAQRLANTSLPTVTWDIESSRYRDRSLLGYCLYSRSDSKIFREQMDAAVNGLSYLPVDMKTKLLDQIDRGGSKARDVIGEHYVKLLMDNPTN